MSDARKDKYLILFFVTLVLSCTYLAPISAHAVTEQRIEAIEDRLSYLGAQEPSWLEITQTVFVALAFCLSVWTWWQQKKTSDRDESIKVFRSEHNNPMTNALGNLDLALHTLDNSCKDKKSDDRIQTVKEIWEGDINECLLKITTFSHALDRDKNVSENNWSEGLDCTRDCLDKVLSDLLQENLTEQQFKQKIHDMIKTGDKLNDYMKDKLEKEIKRRR